MDATPWVALPADAQNGLPERRPPPLRLRERAFVWGERTFLMGIINVTPDSFSGDGLLTGNGSRRSGPTGRAAVVRTALERGRRMVAEGADLLDVGGESSRPGHTPVDEREELARVLPVIEALRNALPEIPLSIDTIKPGVAKAALDAGADLINDVWAVRPDSDLPRVAAHARVPLILMHNREEPRYRNLLVEVLADLAAAVARALDAGVPAERLIVDPGMGFGKSPDHNLALLRELSTLRLLGRPVLLGMSRKSTIGRVLDLPADERLEGTLATTALGIAAGVDIVRVHDVEANRRVARMADAVVRGAPAG